MKAMGHHGIDWMFSLDLKTPGKLAFISKIISY